MLSSTETIKITEIIKITKITEIFILSFAQSFYKIKLLLNKNITLMQLCLKNKLTYNLDIKKF